MTFRLVELDGAGRVNDRVACPRLPPVPSGSAVVLSAGHPLALLESYEAVRAAGAVPLFLHAALPFDSARDLAQAIGASTLVHAPLVGESRVVSFDAPFTRLPDDGHLLCTSGTTGATAPKIFFFPRATAIANARAHLASLGLGGSTGLRIALPMPLGHSFGLVAGLLAAEASHSTLYAFVSTPDPSTLVDVVARERIDVLHLTPPMARVLARRYARRPPPSLPELRVVSVGSASSYVGDLKELQRIAPEARIAATYGLTECGPRVATFDAGTGLAPVGSFATNDSAPVELGVPLEGVELDVADVGADGVGELVVRTPFQATATIVDRVLVRLAGETFRTRDAARRDADGRITLLGRLDGTIVRGGQNVYPANVEPVAERVPGVRAACLVGLPSSTYGEVPVLVCELTPGADSASVRAALEARFEAVLAPTDRPVEVHFTEELPRTSLGKIVRRAVVTATRERKM